MAVEKGSKKREILEAALELFSVQGFEATSVSQIADAVGIRKASLYSHFDGKQAILDELVKEILEQYEQHSIFALSNREKGAEERDRREFTPDTAVQMVRGQIRYILHDPHLVKARKMLVLEQFQNPKLAKLQTKQNYSDVMAFFTDRMKRLVQQGVLQDMDPEIMAAQFCLPISAWINVCDREPKREEEVMDLVERHIRQFFQVYQSKELVMNNKNRNPREELCYAEN